MGRFWRITSDRPPPASGQPDQETQRTGFLSLPPEIRLQIYSYLLPSKGEIEWSISRPLLYWVWRTKITRLTIDNNEVPSRNILSFLLHSNRTIRREALGPAIQNFYSTVTLGLRGSQSADRIIRVLSRLDNSIFDPRFVRRLTMVIRQSDWHTSKWQTAPRDIALLVRTFTKRMPQVVVFKADIRLHVKASEWHAAEKLGAPLSRKFKVLMRELHDPGRHNPVEFKADLWLDNHYVQVAELQMGLRNGDRSCWMKRRQCDECIEGTLNYGQDERQTCWRCGTETIDDLDQQS